MVTITYQMLADEPQLELLKEIFRESFEVNEENVLRAIAAKVHLLPQMLNGGVEEYKRVRQIAWEKHERLRREAWNEYQHKEASAFAEYRRTQEALTADFERTIAQEFVRLYQQCAEE